MGDELAAKITFTLAKSKPNSIADGLLIMTLAVGHVLQTLGFILGCDPKKMCKDFCDALTDYFEMGGDERINDAHAMMQSMKNKDMN